MDLHLYRIKVERPTEPELFTVDAPNSEVVRTVVLSRPTARNYRGQAWHIGNVQEIDRTGLYFALGRTARSTQPVLDGSGNFTEAMFETAPYTHALLDVDTEIVAVAKKASLAPDTAVLAHQLERTLENSKFAKQQKVGFSVSPISDPESFLRALKMAYSIKSFSVTFTKPNPIDVNRLFLEPMERLAREADASRGQATLRGDSLREEPLEDLSRSAAATGDDASARLQFEEGQRPVTRSLSADTVSITQDDLDSPEGRAAGLSKLRSEYHRVRSGDKEKTG